MAILAGDGVRTVGSGATGPRPVSSDGILGVEARPLAQNFDHRGSVCEIHRDSWNLEPHPVQWDFIVTRANVLRGVHVHRLRYDYMAVMQGRGTFGFADLRPNSPSFRRSMTIDVSGGTPCVVVVPPGVAHGIYAQDDMIYLYGLTAYWAGTDEIGCRFDDPGMNIPWPVKDPILLSRDSQLPSFETLLRQFLEAGGVGPGL